MQYGNALELFAALITISSFGWATTNFFKHDTEGNVIQRYLLIFVYLVAGTQLLVLSFFNKTSSWSTALSIPCYIMSATIFWWTINTLKGNKLGLFFDRSAPGGFIANGPYQVIRHPFYTSYLLCWIAGTIATGQPALLIIVLLAGLVYGTAAYQEERRFLASSVGGGYEHYCLETGMFIPRIRRAVNADNSAVVKQDFAVALSKIVSSAEGILDALSGRYVVSELSLDELEKVLSIRRTVFGEELLRAGRGTKVSPGDLDHIDQSSTHLGCRDMWSGNGKVVGVVRLTAARGLVHLDVYRDEYKLDSFNDEEIDHVTIVSRLAVLPQYRKSPAALLLAKKCYEIGLTRLNT